MSSWFPQTKRTLLERCAIRILRTGHIPKHVAFIMDGNRRYAQKLNADKIVGHQRGFEKLAESLSWCRDLGITQVTLYAFSIENFKRPKNEVDGLMDLFRQQFKKLIEEFDKFEQQEICVRIYGKMDLLPRDIQQAVAKVVLRTAKFTKFYLNVCFAYTAREEITNAMNDLKYCVDREIIEVDDINESLLSNAMYSLGLRDPDIMVRTSGEIRFSDFLLWQSRFTMLSFVEVLWPDFSIWNLFSAILQYQLQYHSIQKVRDDYKQYLYQVELDQCHQAYKRYNSNKNQSNGFKPSNGFVNGSYRPRSSSSTDFEHFMQARSQRFECCFQAIRQKRLDSMKCLNDEYDEIERLSKSNDSNNNDQEKVTTTNNGKLKTTNEQQQQQTSNSIVQNGNSNGFGNGIVHRSS